MCDLDKECRIEGKVEGYKVVAVSKKTGKYWSLAMGFEYKDGGKIPKVKKQKRIASHFTDDILEWNFSFREEMTGRTAIFEEEKDARVLFLNVSIRMPSGYYPAIIKATVWDNVLKGKYGHATVFAGERISFGKKAGIAGIAGIAGK